MRLLGLAKTIVNGIVNQGAWLRQGDKARYQKSIKRWATTRKQDFRDLYDITLKHVVPIRLPLILISQIQRSGGTLLSQLFDGHSECYAHPYELYIGFPTKTVWPTLDLADTPDRWFQILFETPASVAFRTGYRKFSRASGNDKEYFLFIFLPAIQREIFLNYCKSTRIASQRDILDAYMTSYFNAWLNNKTAFGPKKIITAFVPSMATCERNVEQFFNLYPDGKLVSILRDPWSWYDSARRHDPTVYGDLERAISLWKESAEAIMRNKQNYGDRVRIIRFEELVTDTESVMRDLSSYLNIAYQDILSRPTFNTIPIKADSSYPVNTYGVLTEPLSRHQESLRASERMAIEDSAGETYKRALQWL